MTNREPLQQPHAQKEKPDGLQTAGPLTDRTDHVRNGGDYTGNCAAKQEQEPVAWKVEVEIANHQGQSEYRTILAFRPDPKLANGTYIVNEVLSATPLYYATPKPNTKVNSEAIPEQISEPVAVVKTLSMGEGKPPFHYIDCRHLPEGTPLYTAPQRCPNCESLMAQNTELDKQLARYEKHGVTCQTFRHSVDASCGECNTQFGAAQEPVASAWWALVMGAAAEIEDASNCLRDEDARRKALGGAKHYRDAANALYTAPQRREWVGLTDEEISKAAAPYYGVQGFRVEAFARAIEVKLKEKNAND
jgi:hypothetical protein